MTSGGGPMVVVPVRGPWLVVGRDVGGGEEVVGRRSTTSVDAVGVDRAVVSEGVREVVERERHGGADIDLEARLVDVCVPSGISSGETLTRVTTRSAPSLPSSSSAWNSQAMPAAPTAANAAAKSWWPALLPTPSESGVVDDGGDLDGVALSPSVGVGLVASVEFGPHDQPCGTGDGAAVYRGRAYADTDLAWVESFGALAEATVLDDDLGGEPAEPEAAVGRDGEGRDPVAACLGDDAFEHPGDEPGGVAGSSGWSRVLQSAENRERDGRSHRETDRTVASTTASLRSATERPVSGSTRRSSSTTVALRAAAASARPAARRKTRRRCTTGEEFAQPGIRHAQTEDGIQPVEVGEVAWCHDPAGADPAADSDRGLVAANLVSARWSSTMVRPDSRNRVRTSRGSGR